MKTVSVAFYMCFGSDFEKKAYIPMLNELGDCLEKCYGIGFPRHYKFSDEPIKKMFLTKIPNYARRFVFNPFIKLIKKPSYVAYEATQALFDYIVSRKVASDKSDIVVTWANMKRTIMLAKSRGKMVVILGLTNEPIYQYQRYTKECETYNIKNKTTYGDYNCADRLRSGMQAADRIIAISKLSLKTYIDAGYNEQMITLIPLNGSRYDTTKSNTACSKRKAFISTASHSLIKGTHRLLLAWKAANIIDIPLLIVGPLDSDIREFISKNGPFDNVEYIGFVNNLQDLYDQYDAVGILLSVSESAGRTTSEMLSLGIPMITSKTATCDIVQDEYNGFVIDEKKQDEIVEKLRWFADDWTRTDEFKKNAIKTMENCGSVSLYGKGIAMFLKELCNESID